MKKRIHICIMATLLIALGYAVCAAQAEKPQYGGTLVRTDVRGTPSCLGYPAEISGGDTPAIQPVLETIIRNDDMGRPTPLLATSWEIAPDKSYIKFIFRKGVKFHDGTDFNAQAVKYNLELGKGRNPVMNFVTTIDVIDDYTLKLNLSKFSNAILNHLALNWGMVASPTAIEKNGKDWAKLNPVGTGPFKFKAYQRDVLVSYEKFDGYWDKGKPYLDAIEFRYVADPTVAKMSFEAGQSHIMLAIDPKIASELQEKGFKIINPEKKNGMVAIVGDTKNPDSIFANKKVREAIEYAIDKDTIAKMIGYGLWVGANQPCPPGRVAYNPNVKGRPYDPEKAKQLLAEAGYSKGFETKVIITPIWHDVNAFTAVQSYLKKVGIDLKLEIADTTRWTSFRNQGWKNCLLGVWLGVDPNYAQSLERSLATNSIENVSMARPNGWDDLIVKALQTTDLDTQKSYLQQLMTIAVDEAMIIPLWGIARTAVVSPKLRDHNFYNWHQSMWTPADAWLSK